jgi:hypothetical protein
MSEFILQLIQEGKPRVVLDYSGCLLNWPPHDGLRDVVESLRRITFDNAYCHAVEWLGTTWDTLTLLRRSVQKFRHHVRAS